MQLTKKHKAYFEAAKEVSKMSDYKRSNVGCVVVYKHGIISTGHSSTKTHPLQKKYNVYRFSEETPHTLHAEIMALLPLIGCKDIDFKKVSVYVYRCHKDGSLALSRPCASCMALIRDLDIKNIYYTGENSYVSEVLI